MNESRNIVATSMLRKSVDWFLYDNGLRLERVKDFFHLEFDNVRF